jgi:hypothetical protein
LSTDTEQIDDILAYDRSYAFVKLEELCASTARLMQRLVDISEGEAAQQASLLVAQYITDVNALLWQFMNGDITQHDYDEASIALFGQWDKDRKEVKDNLAKIAQYLSDAIARGTEKGRRAARTSSMETT